MDPASWMKNIIILLIIFQVVKCDDSNERIDVVENCVPFHIQMQRMGDIACVTWYQRSIHHVWTDTRSR